MFCARLSHVMVHTTDKAPALGLIRNDMNWEPGLATVPSTDFWELPTPYAVRFVKALHQAITLCGGKVSMF
jgi:hypothetical protein